MWQLRPSCSKYRLFLFLLLLVTRFVSVASYNASNHILFYIIYHNKVSQTKTIDYHLKNPCTIPVEIRSTVFFKTIIYRDILPFRYHEWRDKDYVGIITYKVASHIKNLPYILRAASINLETDTTF